MRVNKMFIKPETLDMKSINIWLQSIGKHSKNSKQDFHFENKKEK